MHFVQESVGYHLVRELVGNEMLLYNYVTTKDMKTDGLTKTLSHLLNAASSSTDENINKDPE